jgi:hypothetical protein
MITIDMTKARNIKRDMIRAERAPMLEALDIAYMKALESGQDTASIALEKQRLRDATSHPAIASAQTPEELKALDPLAAPA